MTGNASRDSRRPSVADSSRRRRVRRHRLVGPSRARRRRRAPRSTRSSSSRARASRMGSRAFSSWPPAECTIQELRILVEVLEAPQRAPAVPCLHRPVAPGRRPSSGLRGSEQSSCLPHSDSTIVRDRLDRDVEMSLVPDGGGEGDQVSVVSRELDYADRRASSRCSRAARAAGERRCQHRVEAVVQG